jgi:hypothetical protein
LGTAPGLKLKVVLMSAQASTAQLQLFGRQVAVNVLALQPAGFPAGPRIVAFAARTASSKLLAQGYSHVQANVAALAASAYVKAHG